MTKAELVEEVSRVSDLTKKHSEVIVDTVFESIIEALKRGEKMAWQLNGDAAIRFGDEGLVYVGGGVAWLHLPDVDAQTGYNVFLGLNSAAPWEKARGFLEGRWTRVSDNTAFQLVFGVLYRL